MTHEAFPSPVGKRTAASPRLPLPHALREDLRAYLDAHQVSAEEPPRELTERIAASPHIAFRDTLLAMIRGKGLIDSRVYAAAGVDRRHYSKIRNQADYRPNKTTVLSFAFALQLGLRDAEKLLRSAGYAFSDATDFDLICRYFLEERNYDAAVVNDALYTYHQPLLFGATE